MAQRTGGKRSDGEGRTIAEQPELAGPEAGEGWRLLGRTLREQWRGLALGIGVGLVWTAGKVSVPLLVREAIDEGVDADDPAALLRWSVAIAVAGVVAALFTGMRRWYAFRESRRTEAVLRDRIYAHIQRLHIGYHDRTAAGELMSRANSDLLRIQNAVVLIPLTISNAAAVLAVTVILALIDPVLTLLALGALPLLNVLGKRFATRLHPAVLAVQQQAAAVASVVEESVSGVRVVKGFGSEAVQASRLRGAADDLYEASLGAARVRARYSPAMELLPNLGILAVLAYGGSQVLDGELSLGTLVAFNVYVVLLVWPLRMLGMIIAGAQQAAASAGRVQEVLATEARIVDPRHPVELPSRRGLVGDVVFDGVRFGYEAGRAPVLDGFELHLRPGESVAVVGATGSGKSTVARLLPRFYDVDAGSVRLDGVDVRDLALADLRRAVAVVFEDPFLFDDTVAANTAFAVPDASHDAIVEAARLAGAHEFVEGLPAGYATVVGERGFGLSGGQRQRIAIARAVLADPRVLVLDDATSAVDPTKEHEIRAALEEVMVGRTTLVIAHRPATIALAQRVVLVGEGRVLAEGTHRDLLAGDERYRQVLAATDPTGAPGPGMVTR